MLGKISKVYLLVCLFVITAGYARAEDVVEVRKVKECSDKQDKEASLECIKGIIQKAENPARSIITRNMEPSYVTLGSGVHVGADRTFSKMLYEGQIFKNISWHDGQIWHTSNHYWLDVPVRILVRQLDVQSKPVRTPSFNPGLRVYWHEDGSDKPLAYPFHYYSFGLHHYSNGQEGASTNPDGSVNTVNGSFNTNYAEFAWHTARKSDGFWTRVVFRQHFYGTFESFQHDQYERRHVSGEFQCPSLNGKFLVWNSKYQFKATGTFRSGYEYVVKNDVNPAMNIRAKPSDRWNTTLELIISPQEWLFTKDKWTEMSIYLRYDYGYDYYNINFQNRMNRFQFGLMSRTL